MCITCMYILAPYICVKFASTQEIMLNHSTIEDSEIVRQKCFLYKHKNYSFVKIKLLKTSNGRRAFRKYNKPDAVLALQQKHQSLVFSESSQGIPRKQIFDIRHKQIIDSNYLIIVSLTIRT